MAYIRKQYICGDVIEVEEYHNGRYGAPGESRQKKKKPSKEQIQKQNHLNKIKTIRQLLRTNFRANDYLLDITYRKECRPPDMEILKKDIGRFTRKLRKEYRKRGYELKWVRNCEIGIRGAPHCHMVVNRIPELDIILREVWQEGRVFTNLLYDDGKFKRLAEYLAKSPESSPDKVQESKYSSSRNLKKPKVKKKVMGRRSWSDKAPKKRHYDLDKDSYFVGTNPVTGYLYRHYEFVRRRER